MRLLNLFVFVLTTANVWAQFLAPIECDSTQALLQKHLERELPRDFFVINTTTGISINTNAPAIIGDYKAISSLTYQYITSLTLPHYHIILSASCSVFARIP